MKTVETHGSFEEAVAEASANIQEIARGLREMIIELDPDVVEVPWPKQMIIGYGVGPKKMSEHYCYIAAQKKYVNLGFYYGADLKDPAGLLEGTGKKLRHVKIRDMTTIQDLSVKELLIESRVERQRALGY